MSTLKIENLVAGIPGKQILNGINLTLNSGEVHAIMGPNGAGKSTLASLLLRYYEYRGAIHRALSVVKRRSGPHETTIREMTLGPNGRAVSEPLREFQGVLTGLPTYVGEDASDPAR